MANLGYLQGLAVDSAGNQYFSDTLNQVVWRVLAKTGTIAVVAGNGFQGYSGDGGPATSAQLNYPEGIAVDASGNLLIADSFNNVIREVSAATGVITTVAGTGRYTYPTNLGDGGPATSATLENPQGVAVDGSANIYIADSEDYRVRMVSAATGIITTFAGNGNYGINNGDGGPATSAVLIYPTSLAIGTSGDVFIVASNSIIRMVDAKTQIISTVGGDGDEGESGDGGAAVAAEISTNGIAVDPAGDVFLSGYPGTIRKIDAATGTISRIVGSGYPGFFGDGGSATMAGLDGTSGIAFDASGNLYVVDPGNYRLREVTFQGPAAAPTYSPVAGTYTGTQTVTLSDATANATIYYTVNGTTPTPASAVYTKPISVAASETVQAIAVAIGYTESPVASAAYTITAPVLPAIGSLSPAFTSAGGAAFALTVNGASFTSASVVYWGPMALNTQFVSATQLTAQVPATDIASAGTVGVTVQAPAPGAGTSNTLTFEIDTAGTVAPPVFAPDSAMVGAGASATYPVTLPSSATNVSVNCLNFPAGASCSYSASGKTLTITTALDDAHRDLSDNRRVHRDLARSGRSVTAATDGAAVAGTQTAQQAETGPEGSSLPECSAGVGRPFGDRLRRKRRRRGFDAAP